MLVVNFKPKLPKKLCKTLTSEFKTSDKRTCNNKYYSAAVSSFAITISTCIRKHIEMIVNKNE